MGAKAHGPTVTESLEIEYRYLQTPAAIRERAHWLLARARADELHHWRLDEARLPEVSARVIRETRAVYPDFTQIPYHGRYRHFDVGGVARLTAFEERLGSLDEDEKLAARAELVITSVLLDAGAGDGWTYQEAGGQSYQRSEGLAVASYHLFNSGAFAHPAAALRADARGLGELEPRALLEGFQVSQANPLAGATGRVALLRKLGEVIATDREHFASSQPRLGDLALFLRRQASAGKRLPAARVLEAVLEALGPIWQGRAELAGRPLGDVWRHSQYGLFPFHKLSQWLSYSLFEPLEASGLTITDIDELTGLAEYRNGGLFIDAGVLEPRREGVLAAPQRVDSDLVIEWRALTIALLDRVAALVRAELGLTPEQLPLARVLEGGTWRAGRAIARDKREGGGPPLKIHSDGTVF
jgi:hypothetical protein